ncbi:hypothetical protein [Alsobacter sp. R-9]
MPTRIPDEPRRDTSALPGAGIVLAILFAVVVVSLVLMRLA